MGDGGEVLEGFFCAGFECDRFVVECEDKGAIAVPVCCEQLVVEVSKVDGFRAVGVRHLSAEFFGSYFNANAAPIAGWGAAGEFVALGVDAAAGFFDAFVLLVAVRVAVLAGARAVFEDLVVAARDVFAGSVVAGSSGAVFCSAALVCFNAAAVAGFCSAFAGAEFALFKRAAGNV